MTTTTEQTWNFGRLDDYDKGPWTGEPDKVYWIDPATQLDCLILRNRIGALCGYVGLPPEHPWHGKGYDDCTLPRPCDDEFYCEHSVARVEVHGGLTYAAPCPDEHKEDGICHVALPGRPESVWWFGFDCAHAGDLDPYRAGRPRVRIPGDVYRDVAYVKREVTSLASQLAAVSS